MHPGGALRGRTEGVGPPAASRRPRIGLGTNQLGSGPVPASPLPWPPRAACCCAAAAPQAPAPAPAPGGSRRGAADHRGSNGLQIDAGGRLHGANEIGRNANGSVAPAGRSSMQNNGQRRGSSSSSGRHHHQQQQLSQHQELGEGATDHGNGSSSLSPGPAAAAAPGTPPEADNLNSSSGSAQSRSQPHQHHSSSSSNNRSANRLPAARHSNQKVPPAAWDINHPHTPAAGSPVRRGDTVGRRIEGIFQSVLGFPRLPAPVHVHLARARAAGGASAAAASDIGRMADTVERLAARFGTEVTLYLLRRAPAALLEPYSVLSDAAGAVSDALRLAASDLPLVLRKAPRLLLVAPDELLARVTALPDALGVPPDQARLLAIKFPPVLTRPTASVVFMGERLRALAARRGQWTQDVACISPSLLAYFLRDFGDMTLRMEYLIISGEAPGISLRDVMKPSLRGFATRHPAYPAWSADIRRRRREAAARKEANAIKAAIAWGESEGDTSEESEADAVMGSEAACSDDNGGQQSDDAWALRLEAVVENLEARVRQQRERQQQRQRPQQQQHHHHQQQQRVSQQQQQQQRREARESAQTAALVEPPTGVPAEQLPQSPLRKPRRPPGTHQHHQHPQGHARPPTHDSSSNTSSSSSRGKRP